MAPPVAGNGLALSTGTAGCSAYQIDSKPRRSALRPMKAGSMGYAGDGMGSPVSMGGALRCCGRPKPSRWQEAQRSDKIRLLLGLVSRHRSRRAALKRGERDAKLTTGAFKHGLGVIEIASLEQERRELDA